MSTKKPSKNSSEQHLKSFADHLGELRTRLVWVALVFIVVSAFAYNVRDQLVAIVLSPIGDQQLIYLTPAGGFAFIFQITLYAGMLATAPIAVYHLYRFVLPALPEQVRHRSILIVFISTLLMFAGVLFGYFAAIPAALQFLTTFAGGFVQPSLTADSYLSFVVAYVLGLGLLFQLPLLLVLWNWIQPFKPGGLLGTQRYVLVGSFIAAAMITPTPDVINQCLIAVPIIGIYQLGVIAVFMMNRRSRRPVVAQTSTPSKLIGNIDEPFFAVSFPEGVPVESPKVVAPVPVRQSLPVPVSAGKYASTDGFRRPVRGAFMTPIRLQQQKRPATDQALKNRPVSSPNVSVDGFAFVRSN